LIFWVVALALTAVVAWFVVRPLLRPRAPEPARSEHAFEVYRDQIAEIDQDLERGLITADQASAARTEIERRILAVASSRESGRSGDRPSTVSYLVPVAIAGLIPLAVFALYLRLGSPDLPSQPFASRTDRAQVATEARDFEALVARLAERQARSPDNLEGWVMLGRSYGFMERHAEAAESYRRALDLSGGDPEIASAYGEALTLANDGIVTPAARDAFDAALRARPGDVRAQFYLALALEQAGELRKALDRFADLARVSPPEAPWVPALRGRIESLARTLGLDPRQILTQQPLAQSAPPAGGGFVPMPEGAESVAGLPTGEIEAIMRQRVEGLAARLQKQPDDVEGWLQLARSYRVLGDLPKSREAIAGANRAAAKSGPEARALVADTARQLGLGDNDKPAATTGPNR